MTKLRPCSRCHRTSSNMRLYKEGDYLCPRCRKDRRVHRDKELEGQQAPEVMRRTLTSEGEVVIAGKDVPYGHQDDPKVIQEKLDKIERDKTRDIEKSLKKNKEWWEKMTHQDYNKFLENKGIQALRERGMPEGQIQEIIRLSKKGGGKTG